MLATEEQNGVRTSCVKRMIIVEGQSLVENNVSAICWLLKIKVQLRALCVNYILVIEDKSSVENIVYQLYVGYWTTEC